MPRYPRLRQSTPPDGSPGFPLELVTIRPPSEADKAEFIHLNRISGRLHRPWVYPPANDEAWAEYMDTTHRADARKYLVCLADSGAIAGAINISEIVRGGFQSAYLGYHLGAPYTGRGYMTAGLTLVLNDAFTSFGLHRLEANIQPLNLRSRALVQRLGFRLEGLSPRYLKVGGRWRDHERWAITREEWRPARSGA